jgi:hypothetical protein
VDINDNYLVLLDGAGVEHNNTSVPNNTIGDNIRRLFDDGKGVGESALICPHLKAITDFPVIIIRAACGIEAVIAAHEKV